MNSYRVEVAYRFKSNKRPGVVLGMTIKAETMDDAIDEAVAKHITPYPARIHLQTMACEQEGAR